MRCDITTAEAVLFAVAVYDAVKEANPEMPNMVIIQTGLRVNFKADDIPSQVLQIVEELTNVSG